MRYNAIHRRAGQHDNPGACRLAAREVENFDRGADTLAKLGIGIAKGIADQSTAGAMNDKIDGFGERCKRVAGYIAGMPAGQCRLGIHLAVADADDPAAARSEMLGDMTTDEAECAGDEDGRSVRRDHERRSTNGSVSSSFCSSSVDRKLSCPEGSLASRKHAGT